MSRYRVLTAEARRLRERLGKVGQDALLELLSSHEGAPYSPCRHPEGDVSGATLGTALFDVAEGRRRLYVSNPCRGRSRPW
jgi:hypothetical protein